MKDYTFGEREYKENFILNYTLWENNTYLIVRFADGHKAAYKNTIDNKKMILERMKKQVLKADEYTKNIKVKHTKMNILRYLRMYLMVKTKMNDIEKNKLIIENIDCINYILDTGIHYFFDIPIYIERRITWKDFNLNSADKFSLDEVKQIMSSVSDYQRNYVKKEAL